MARSPLTLAALATSAVAGLDLVGASPLGSPGGAFDAALLAGRDGRYWVIRVPRTQAAEAEQSADMVALRAISAGVRERLPFSVTVYAGQVPVGHTRAVVSEFVVGSKTPLSGITLPLATSIGEAIGSIHTLPTSFVTDAGLAALSSVHALQETTALIDRAIATGLVPAALRDRWERALAEMRLWQFQPTVVNGALGPDAVLSSGEQVTGILGWHALRVADPARDLAWLLGGRQSAMADAVFEAYTRVRGTVDGQLRQRATLYAELEIAKWLLHGTEVHSTEIVDDAVQLLHGLVDDVQNDLMAPIGPQTMPVLAVDEVEAMLDRVERAG